MPTDYTLTDATLEILIMLLAAFLLGWLFCWLMKKLFGNTPDTGQTSIDLNEKTSSINRPNMGRLNAELGNTDLDLAVDSPEIDKPSVDLNAVDLPKKPTASSAGIPIETPTLKKARPRIDLPDFNAPDLDIKDALSAGVDTGKTAIGTGLGAAAAGIGAVAAGASALKESAVDKIQGSVEIPDVSDITTDAKELGADIDLPSLNKADLETAIDLPEVKPLNTDIDLADAKLPGTETGIELPEATLGNLDTDIDLPTESANIDTEAPTPDSVDAGLSKLDNDTLTTTSRESASLDEAEQISSLTQPDLPMTSEAVEVNDGRVTSNKSTTDNLTRISGVDSHVVSLLNANGIHNYQDLQAMSRTQLKTILDETGDAKLRALEPASWPHQATLCANRNWSKLSEYQSFLTGSNLDTRQTTATSVPDETDEGDDLKKIEGIGPFFESLLNDAGITTYEHLKNSSRDTLKEIIDAAGPDYRMHEPETWPYQAGLAHRGEWKKLQDYIQFMTGRG